MNNYWYKISKVTQLPTQPQWAYFTPRFPLVFALTNKFCVQVPCPGHHPTPSTTGDGREARSTPAALCPAAARSGWTEGQTPQHRRGGVYLPGRYPALQQQPWPSVALVCNQTRFRLASSGQASHCHRVVKWWGYAANLHPDVGICQAK